MRKGFTLIELLAVIVILAIIALIATPIILGVVENARKSAAGSSALGYLDAVEKDIALGSFNELVYPTGKIDIKSVNPYDKIEVQGEAPSEGTLFVLDDYQIEAAILCVNDYRVDLLDYKIYSIEKGCDDMNAKFLMDYSGNKNYGYLNRGPIWENEGLTFDGVNDYVYVGEPNHEFQDAFTMVARFKIMKINENGVENSIIANAEEAGASMNVNGAECDDGKICFVVMPDNKNKYVAINDKEEIVLDKWYTVVGKLENNKLFLYINGEKVSEVEFDGKVKNSVAPFAIGANPSATYDDVNKNGYCYFFANMEFTDALIFDRALSEKEIKKEFSDKITKISNKSKMLLRYDLDM